MLNASIWRAGDPRRRESRFDLFELVDGRWQWAATFRSAEGAQRAAGLTLLAASGALDEPPPPPPPVPVRDPRTPAQRLTDSLKCTCGDFLLIATSSTGEIAEDGVVHRAPAAGPCHAEYTDPEWRGPVLGVVGESP